MAHLLGCTLDELGARMSAREFALHQAYMRRVPTGTEGALHLWSRLMSMLANGPTTRRDKRPWAPADFCGDPFAVPKAAPPAGPSVNMLKAFIGRLKNR